MKKFYFVSIVGCLMPLAGCAGALGPPLGLGPGPDQALWIGLFILAGGLLWRPIRGMYLRWLKPGGTPENILRTRYAQGEISEEQYQRMSQTLAQSKGQSA